MGLLNKFKDALNDGSVIPAGPAAPPGAPPDRRSIYQNRRNFGVNFGSQFVLERFIFDRFFVDDTNTEFEAISAYIKKNGAEKTAQDLEGHYKDFVSDDDWNWLKSKGITGVRVPLGYWHVNGGAFTKGTPFEKISDVYKNSWTIFKQLIEKAKSYDIGVLVDLHALPGGANTGDHSGIQLKSAGFWGSRSSEKLALEILSFIAQDLSKYENVIGLQIVNESEFDNNATNQKHYYVKAISEIHKVNPTLPIVISDGWWTDQWVKWINETEHKVHGQSLGVVIDAHIYRCFDGKDKQKPAEQIINDLEQDALTHLSGSADIIIGEYSHVLDEETWNKSSADKGELVKSYGQKLSQVFEQRANTGTFFWTFKFQHGDGGEWGAVPQINSGALPSRSTQVNQPSEQDFKDALGQEFQNHEGYWNSQNQNEKYEHWRYQEGFTTGWADSVEFSKFDGSKIGRVNAWTSSRRTEHIKNRGDSKYLWEWDQGFLKGIERAQQAIFG